MNIFRDKDGEERIWWIFMRILLFMGGIAAILGFLLNYSQQYSLTQQSDADKKALEYERGYMDGFREGMLMCGIDYGTIKLERKGGEE